ncbi:MAG: 2-amino-4-oxopentanoate thiolase subunit OrtA [Tissierellaceae bacterium]|nr:2-amino-4-oxopentanoate thiolase subunit OrtA [Tissierellaceae bacterium]
MNAKRGDWVRIHNIILEVGKRSTSIPEDTQNVPLEMWVKGFLLDDEADIGDKVKVETYIGRIVEGTLTEVNPYYKHNFGNCIPELLYIGRQGRQILAEEGEKND